MPLILAKELDTLTVQDIQKWDQRAGDRTHIYIDVIDKHNLTHERLERLTSLIRERDKPSESRAVNADELSTKLRQISPRRSPTPSDAPSTPVTAGAELTEEELIEHTRYSAYENYKDLKNVGGRPPREINPDPGPCPPWKSDIDKRYHAPDHWNGELWRTRDELTLWLDFRWHQFKKREDSKIFNKYKEAVHRYQQEKGTDWVVELQLNRQTKLDEWREYYIYEYRKRDTLEKELSRAKRELETAEERMMKAKQNGSVGIPEAVLWKRAAEMVRYREKISQAQKEVEIAQKRLEVLGVEELLSTTERNILTEQAEEDLKSAQKRLEAEKSDEIEQLRKEAQRDVARSNLGSCQVSVNYANTRLERLDTLLEWIAGQSTEVATEYASSSWGSKHNRDLLDGWEKYYVYMRERLKRVNEQEETCFLEIEREKTKTEEVMNDLLCPQDRVRPLKALLAWVEREFPEIAAKYTPFSQDSQFNGNHQDQDRAVLPYSKPSPSGPVRNASLSSVAGKSTRPKRKSARERSPLSQVQPSKVFKSGQRRKRPLNQKLSTTCYGMGPPEGRTDNIAHVEVQEPPKVALRRSKRISQRTCYPTSPPPSLVGPLRRSACIPNRIKKLRSRGSDQDVQPAQSSSTARQKSTRRTTVHTNSAYSGKPQGISKTRR
ncbi:hypothetical protein M501DRAFT_990484 [Patellaria atrata CBS 101060]|uniref:Uncharacterized protein n=1 Tax=Patellaria atrata CBS 101060 TaxID=1346257 RepID=A0A9P4VM18_9PEZI|nr:hypothetical protein M501DRAFT_990484 [Patellaria atrata CBS 101060]